MLDLDYDQPLFRPPSEWRSLILQLTLGCSHNRCSFCAMYRTKRFRIRRLTALKDEIDAIATSAAEQIDRVFLADGDALVVKTSTLLELLGHLRQRFPRLRRVHAYATPQNLLQKSLDELSAIRAAGLGMLYVGLESGDGEVLRDIDKGVDPEQFVEACARAHRAGFKLSITVLNNLVAPVRSAAHVSGTVAVINQVAPAYLACLTLIPGPAAERHAQATGWTSMRDREVVAEIAAMVEGVSAERVEFRANHASNPLPIKGRLQRDKARILAQLAAAEEHPDYEGFRPVWMRGL